MSCRACGAERPDDARFCPACGTRVEPTCRACGRVLPEGARFCPGRSDEMARAANDRLLLTRCDNNLPSVMLGNGSPLVEVLPIAHEGLEVLRRSGDNVSLAWLARTIGDAMFDRGEIREAMACFEEALVAADAIDEACGTFPVLGPLPEGGWVAPEATPAGTGG